MTTPLSQFEFRPCIYRKMDFVSFETETKENKDQPFPASPPFCFPEPSSQTRSWSGECSFSYPSSLRGDIFLISPPLFQNYHCLCPLPHTSHQFLGCKQSCLVFGVDELYVDLILHDPACRLLGEELASFSFPGVSAQTWAKKARFPTCRKLMGPTSLQYLAP